MDVAESLKGFFDLPKKRLAADPAILAKYLDPDPRTTLLKQFNKATATFERTSQFQSTGDIPPLRESKPNKFDSGSRTIVKELRQKKTYISPKFIPTKERTPPPTELNQDSSLFIGLKSSEFDYVAQKVEEIENSFYEWDSEKLQHPTERRLHNKIECEIQRKHKRNKKHSDHVQKIRWKLPISHPSGVIGIKAPKSEKQQVRSTYTKNKILKENQRKDMLSSKMNANSGLLYHVPVEFQHNLKTNPLFTKKFRSTGCPEALKATKERVFEATKSNKIFGGH